MNTKNGRFLPPLGFCRERLIICNYKVPVCHCDSKSALYCNYNRFLYFGKKFPPSPGGGEYQLIIWGRNMKRRREKGGNVKKGKKGKEKKEERGKKMR